MPNELYARLEKSADKKGLTGDRKAAYVNETMQKVTNQSKRKKQATDHLN